MNTQIKIKAVGHTVGTVGWLHRGLTDGSITLNEGTTKAGEHGLWIKTTIGGTKCSEYLAGVDEFGLGERDPYNREYRPTENPADEKSLCAWTDAAWLTVRQIAQDWCDTCNAIREADVVGKIKINIIRVEA